jgi:hypothetical protein
MFATWRTNAGITWYDLELTPASRDIQEEQCSTKRIALVFPQLYKQTRRDDEIAKAMYTIQISTGETFSFW